MEPPRENNSPSTPSRYLNSYLQQNSTELFHQNFPQRQLGNQQFYAADNLSTNNKNYLKRHHQSYHSEKNEPEREKKYDKKLEDPNLQHASYDGFSNDGYAPTNITTPAVTPATPTAAGAASSQKPGPKSLSNGKKTKGRVKIKMEYIDNKLRRYTTFSKRKTGIMKKVSGVVGDDHLTLSELCQLGSEFHSHLHHLYFAQNPSMNFKARSRSRTPAGSGRFSHAPRARNNMRC
jgi:SRF-type transcription factor (DNA-binding and dimerisation domain)